MSHSSRIHDVSAPQPPVRPGIDDCCRSGCTPCVFDLYEEALERYRIELKEFREMQEMQEMQEKQAMNKPTKQATDKVQSKATGKNRGRPC